MEMEQAFIMKSDKDHQLLVDEVSGKVYVLNRHEDSSEGSRLILNELHNLNGVVEGRRS